MDSCQKTIAALNGEIIKSIPLNIQGHEASDETVNHGKRNRNALWGKHVTSFISISPRVFVSVLELFEIMRRVTWPKVTLLIVNAGIVVYLSFILFQFCSV